MPQPISECYIQPTVTPLVAARSVRKSYPGIRALDGVSFDLYPGEVHALVGGNGAGKSTLIKVMSGEVAADAGTVEVSGEAVPWMTPGVARSLGIAVIHQQPCLFGHLSVAENIAFVLEERRDWRRIDWNRRRRVAADLLARVAATIDPERLVETLSMPEQQLVEIAKAVGAHARVLIMDEPTASLSDREVTRLFEVIRRLRSEGAGVIYISHRLEEVFAIADRVTVLRDGQTVGTRDRAALTPSALVGMMIGRELANIFPKRSVERGGVALELRHISSRAAGVRDISFSLHSGEILGLAGLVGSGRTELAGTIFGLTPPDSGELLVRGERAGVESPADAIRHGIGYVPEDRRRHGVVPEMAIAENTSLASLGEVAHNGLIDRRAEQNQAREYVQQLQIKAPSVAQAVESLSGGNQQKVALAKWLATKPSILILDEPTQGVDVGAKAEIHSLMQEMAARGLAILMISSELPEILGMSDRIAVMRDGTIAGVLAREEATQERVMAMALGQC
jgi:rhamnose transport system ATP-binding protein